MKSRLRNAGLFQTKPGYTHPTCSAERDFVDAAPMRCCAQQPLSRVDLQIEDRGAGQAVIEHMPVLSAIIRMPHADVGSDINVVRRYRVYGERIVFNVEQIISRHTVARMPSRTIKPPDPGGGTHSAKGDIYGLPVGVRPIHRHIGYQTVDVERAGSDVVDLRHSPRRARAVRAEDLAGGCPHKQPR